MAAGATAPPTRRLAVSKIGDHGVLQAKFEHTLHDRHDCLTVLPIAFV